MLPSGAITEMVHALHTYDDIDVLGPLTTTRGLGPSADRAREQNVELLRRDMAELVSRLPSLTAVQQIQDSLVVEDELPRDSFQSKRLYVERAEWVLGYFMGFHERMKEREVLPDMMFNPANKVLFQVGY
jgi:hypothetical protein